MWGWLLDSTRWIDSATAWMLTYLLHSTILLGIAVAVARWLPDRFLPIKETVWRSALVGGLLTATLQVGLGIAPLAGSWQIGLATAVETPAIALRTEVPPFSPAAVGILAQQMPPTSQAIQQLQPTAAQQVISAPPLSRWLLAGWLTIGLFLLGLVALSYHRLLRRLDSRRSLTDGPLPSILRRLIARTTAHPTRLASSEQINVPLARGIRQREICLPQRMVIEMPEERLEIVLAHELAHLERRDPVWLLAMRGLESLFFFQPLNRYARRALQEIAEYRCDDWAVSRTGRPVSMARCLTDVAGWNLDGRVPDLVSTMAVDRSQLGRRVSRLLARNYPLPPVTSPSWLGGVALLLLVFVVVVAPGVTRASASPSASDGPEIIVLGDSDSVGEGADAGRSTVPDVEPEAAPVLAAAPEADPTDPPTAPEAHTAPTAPVPPAVTPVVPTVDSVPPVPSVAPSAPTAPTAPIAPALSSDSPSSDQPGNVSIETLAPEIEVRLAALQIDLEPLEVELEQLVMQMETQIIDSEAIERLVHEAEEMAASIEIPVEMIAELEHRALELATHEPLTHEQQEQINQLAKDAAQMAIDPELTARLSEISVEIAELAVPDPEILARIQEISAEIARTYTPSAEEIRELTEAAIRMHAMSTEERDLLREETREARDMAREMRDQARQERDRARLERDERDAGREMRDQARRERDMARQERDQAREEARSAREAENLARDEARRAREAVEPSDDADQSVEESESSEDEQPMGTWEESESDEG